MPGHGKGIDLIGVEIIYRSTLRNISDLYEEVKLYYINSVLIYQTQIRKSIGCRDEMCHAGRPEE